MAEGIFNCCCCCCCSSTLLVHHLATSPPLAAVCTAAADAAERLPTLITYAPLRGRDWVVEKLDFERGGTVSFFETVIRILGGLAAAADLSGDARLGAKAADLAGRLLPAFSSTPTGARGSMARGAALLTYGLAVGVGALGSACPGLHTTAAVLSPTWRCRTTPAPRRPDQQRGQPAARDARLGLRLRHPG